MKRNSSESTADRSVALFDSGLYCAESVLLAIAESEGVDCHLIPRIATGLCSGVARTCGLCGAVSGAILAIGLVMGRSSGDETIDTTYDTVRFVLRGFEAEFGSSNCRALLGCDLGTEEGQRFHQENDLREVCKTYMKRATQLTLDAIKVYRGSD